MGPLIILKLRGKRSPLGKVIEYEDSKAAAVNMARRKGSTAALWAAVLSSPLPPPLLLPLLMLRLAAKGTPGAPTPVLASAWLRRSVPRAPQSPLALLLAVAREARRRGSFVHLNCASDSRRRMVHTTRRTLEAMEEGESGGGQRNIISLARSDGAG